MMPKQIPQQGSADSPPETQDPRRRRAALLLQICGLALFLYLLTAYVVLPLAWKRDVARHPTLFDAPRVTHTIDGIPGDPVNVALEGSEADVIRALRMTKWYPADPITLRSSLRIAIDSVLRDPDDEAPVSTLELFGRKQDLAFEQPVGDNPRQRHHVRFWRWDRLEDGREVWFGAATYDERVGLSHTTGQVTHHIGPDIDAERDRILSQLQQAGLASEVYWMPRFHTELHGRNGGGDPWHTDGRLGVAVLRMLTNAPSLATNSPAL
jgi:LssY C-terminus